MNGTVDGECDYCGAEDALNEYREHGGYVAHICDSCLAMEGVEWDDPDYPEEDDDDED